ncbi:MAG: NADH:ubiquinone oxidoreductase subunit NDUFA12 [Alphaproteobacteria bacterium]|nr:NADH:ubiquinone oxidoreductase subunit NDUFA12 [Alphaproteobacteria bacterium]
MTIGTRLYTWLKGEPVGTDSFGNRYFRERGVADQRRAKRWVLYNGEAEASKVPPDWHGWLHRTVDTVPPAGGGSQKPWQKEHLPNLTGTPLAYRPPGHVLQGGQRDKATGDYEPWKPV